MAGSELSGTVNGVQKRLWKEEDSLGAGLGTLEEDRWRPPPRPTRVLDMLR